MGNEGHQASNIPNYSTPLFSKHMLSEAEEAIGSRFTAPLYMCLLQGSLSGV